MMGKENKLNFLIGMLGANNWLHRQRWFKPDDKTETSNEVTNVMLFLNCVEMILKRFVLFSLSSITRLVMLIHILEFLGSVGLSREMTGS